MIEELKWDSGFFNIKTGEWDADAGPIGSPHGFDLIYVKSDTDINPEIEGFEKSFTETKLVFTKELAGKKDKDSNIHSAGKNEILKDIYALAYESGRYSRFRLDQKFGSEKFRKLYNAWIDNSLNGQFADEVLLYIYNDRPCGLVTYKNRGEYAVIGLIAVDATMQGMGIGKKLLDFAEARLLEKKCKELRIPTQLENKQACEFYKKQGYTILEIKHIMHFWRK